MWLPALSALCLLAGSRWRSVFLAGVLLELSCLAGRGLSAGRLPLIGPHDTLLLFAVSIAVMGGLASLAPSLRSEQLLLPATGWISGGFTLAALMFKPLNMPLPLILDTVWFELHVILAFFSYALFTVGGVLCALYLFNGRQRHVIDVQFKVALVGWAFFSASMITGGIWGYYAWGTYWLWTAKELWTSILWLYYSLLLHLRLKGGLRGVPAACAGIAGVCIMLFTYLGVSMLMKSSHSF